MGYWEDRFNAIQDLTMKNAEKESAKIQLVYEKALAEVERDIALWFNKFATDNQITLQEAKRLLTSGELRTFKGTLNEYIALAKASEFDDTYIKLLENTSRKVRITRLESLRLQLEYRLHEIESERVAQLDSFLPDVIIDRRGRIAYEVQKGFEVAFAFNQIDNNQIQTLIRKPWAPDGINFSERIWRDTSQLNDYLETQLVQNLVKGDGSRVLIKDVSKRFKVSKGVAGRLVMSESAYFSSVSQQQTFKDLGIEYYQYLATLDNSTSEICREMDDKIIPMKDYQIGVTAPPLHVWCRSTTVPFFADDYSERVGRDATGGRQVFPSGIGYREWERMFYN